MRPMLTPLLVPALLVGLAAASGCQSTAPPAAGPDPVSEAAQPRVLAQDELHGKLVTGKPIISRAEAGGMRVTVPVRTQLRKDVRVQYRFTFFDDRGRPLQPDPDWQYTILPARTQMFLDGFALQTDTADWRLEVRPTR